MAATALRGRLKTALSGPATPRPLEGPWRAAFRALAIFFALFYLYCAGPPILGDPSVGAYRGLFLLLALSMVFLQFPAFPSGRGRMRPSAPDLVLIAMTVVSYGYYVIAFDTLVHRVGYYTTIDFVMAAMAAVVALEGARRVIGWMLPTLGLFFLVYAVHGDLFPQIVSHRGYPLGRVLTDLFTQEGIFGLVLEVTAAFVVLFVVFGALMNVFGAGAFFVRLPYAMTAGARGGPAKAAVLASGMMGMISGSAVANTVATGAFTIPLMIKAGYKRHVAGAIEPAASTGGMFMPPIMGAGVFIMAEMIGVPYADIMIVALAPALLYFFSVGAVAHFEALREGVPAVPKSERESVAAILREGWFFLIPILFVIVAMLWGMSPSRAVFFTILLLIALAVAARLVRREPGESYAGVARRSGRDLVEGLEQGAADSLVISAIVGTVGIILGAVFLTGLGFMFTSSVMQFTSGLLPVGIFLALVASYVLGMGMTVTSAYILMAILVAPALQEMGVPALAAHMLVFWYSQSSNISPPVCMAAFAGASIATADPMKTGFTALKFSVFLFIIPVLFVYTPLMMPEGLTLEAARAMATTFIAVIPAAAALTGYLRKPTTLAERVGLAVAALCLVTHPITLNALGLALFVTLWALQGRRAAAPAIAESSTGKGSLR